MLHNIRTASQDRHLELEALYPSDHARDGVARAV
jgi:hypothetical protein